MSKNNHILVTPVYNLKLSPEIKKELYVEDVYFIDRKKVSRNIKKAGFPWNFKELKKILKGKPQPKYKIQNIKEFFYGSRGIKADTFAIIRIASDATKDYLYGDLRRQ